MRANSAEDVKIIQAGEDAQKQLKKIILLSMRLMLATVSRSIIKRLRKETFSRKN